MRKLLLIVASAFLFTLSMSAQEGLKGTWFAGGQLSFGQIKNDDSKVNTTMVLPIAGTFVTPSIAIGAGIGYEGGKEKSGGEQIAKSDAFIFKPLVRKYWNITGGLYFYGQAALPMIFGSGEAAKGVGKSNSTTIGLELSPGLDFVVNSWLTLETSFTILNVGYNRLKPKGGSASTSFNFNANPFNSMSDRKIGDLQVGVKFLF